MKRILVYRFSAMGDVVMLLPVLKGLLESNAELEIHLLTQPFLFPVFEGVDRLHLVSVDLKGKHKGVRGLYRLYRQLKKEINPDEVFDLHQVLRTHVLNFFFRRGGYQVNCFQKGREDKKEAVHNKLHKQLPSSIDRYAAAFSSAGYRFIMPKPPLFPESSRDDALDLLEIDSKSTKVLIGVAPFAKHQQKVWGADKTHDLLKLFSEIPKSKVILFGGGKAELEILDQLAGEFSNCLVAGHHIKFTDEIKLLPHLDIMISMDSANMHLAAMAGIPVVSIWGATHPSLGFAPYHQPEEYLIQYTGHEINCRPCSVFGNKKCIYGDVRCMKYIPVSQVAERVGFILGQTLPN
ncbi:glycosyltransferase family 9 protein [Mangrovibacterium lignilyticum]|uniref:glycosyltransferase family 9 protein n=1 Tax=Mangrovibacterium lignilyticum TaxID=2668052 RepID=UPI0013D03080|nr:glycosyltransferase family 9 protein [Mangrovibacterium lignilyticum]